MVDNAELDVSDGPKATLFELTGNVRCWGERGRRTSAFAGRLNFQPSDSGFTGKADVIEAGRFRLPKAITRS